MHEEVLSNDVAESACYIRVVLELPEARLDVICMDNNFTEWVRDAKVPYSSENLLLKDIPKDAF